MFNKVIINVVIGFVLRQLDKFKGQINWTQVEKDLDDRVRAVIPGKWFDDEAVSLVNSLLGGIQYALKDDSKLKAILDALSVADWMTAFNSLKALILGAWTSGAIASTDQAKKDIIA